MATKKSIETKVPGPPEFTFSSTPMAHTCSMVEIGGLCITDWGNGNIGHDLLQAIRNENDYDRYAIALHNSNQKLEGWDAYLVNEYEGNNGFVWVYMIPLERDLDEDYW
jgi:hypothetical protein